VTGLQWFIPPMTRFLGCVVVLLMTTAAIAQASMTNKPAWKQAVAPVKVTSTNLPTEIRIVSVEGVLSSYHRCVISGKGAPGRVLLQGMPPMVKQAHDEVTRLQTFIARESAAIKADQKLLSAERAAAPSSASALSPAGQYIRQLNIRQNALNERDKDLSDAQDSLDEAKKRFTEMSEMMGVNTGLNYASLPVWRVIGPIVEKQSQSTR
jgi:hypothetical protein